MRTVSKIVSNGVVLNREVFKEYKNMFLYYFDYLCDLVDGNYDTKSFRVVKHLLTYDNVGTFNIYLDVYAEMVARGNKYYFVPKVVLRGLPSAIADDESSYSITSVLRKLLDNTARVEKDISALDGVELFDNEEFELEMTR